MNREDPTAIWSPGASTRCFTGMPLTNVPESLSKSTNKKRSSSQLTRQWIGETVVSSRQIELEELRPIDRTPANRNSDFRSGPLRTASLGCMVSGIPATFSPGKPIRGRGDILTPTLSRGHCKNSLLSDSATIRMVRFSPGGLLWRPSRAKPDLSACFSIGCKSAGRIADAPQLPKTFRTYGRAAAPTNEPDSRGFLKLGTILPVLKPDELASPFNSTSSVSVRQESRSLPGVA